MKNVKPWLFGVVVGVLIGMWIGVNIGKGRPVWSNPFAGVDVGEKIQQTGGEVLEKSGQSLKKTGQSLQQKDPQ